MKASVFLSSSFVLVLYFLRIREDHVASRRKQDAVLEAGVEHPVLGQSRAPRVNLILPYVLLYAWEADLLNCS